MKKFLAILAFTFFFIASFAQQQEPEMADAMRSNGKIYVLVTAIMIVLGGLLVYLFFLDRKITKLERKIGERE
jgi:CcmD family protein